MDSFTDYYAILGIEKDAPPGAIKAAFKRLALQYHPDIYKGEDAHERMRVLLQAYQTLNDPTARRQYDARRSEYIQDGRGGSARPVNTPYTPPRSTVNARPGSSSDVSPAARRDRQRHYDFPDFRDGQSARVDLSDIAYTLSPVEARLLLQDGLLRGVAPENGQHAYYCHRCRHHWPVTRDRRGNKDLPRYCPKCHAMDWTEYLLLRCVHCCAVFESEQIRNEVGTYTYGKKRSPRDANAGLCPPYELFPLCPFCGTAHWCPSEEARVSELRQRAAQPGEKLKKWLSSFWEA